MLVIPLVLIQFSAKECWLTGQNAGLTFKMRVTWHVCVWPGQTMYIHCIYSASH